MEEKRKETPAQAGNSYLALDLETTGLDPKRDKIIEIGACRVRDGEIEKELSLLIHPHQPLPERITALTGITDEMLSEAPDMESVIGQVMDFCGDLPILGHHVIFDYSFLKRAAVNAGFPFERTDSAAGLCQRRRKRICPPPAPGIRFRRRRPTGRSQTPEWPISCIRKSGL